MKSNLFFIFFLFCFSVFSQINFEPGYFIDTTGEKISCLIKNEDWKNNPISFEYNLGENQDIKTGTLLNIREFGIGQKVKFLRADVQIDRSGNTPLNFSSNRRPVMEEEKLFLKVLVEGKANLLYYEERNLKRYFQQVEGDEIKQLIYKKYLTPDKKIRENENYKQQLLESLTCSGLQLNDFENLEYNKGKLTTIFEEYNACENSESTVYSGQKKGFGFNLSLRPGFYSSSMSIQKPSEGKEIAFDQKTGFRLGVEAEYVLPFNRNKWALFIEPTYRSYEAEKEVQYVNFPTIKKYTQVSVTFTTIDIPIGVRHYFFLNDKAAIFVNMAAIFNFDINSNIESSNENTYDLEVNGDIGSVIGLGFKYDNKYSIEAQYLPSRQVLNYLNWNSSYQAYSIVLGYNFL